MIDSMSIAFFVFVYRLFVLLKRGAEGHVYPLRLG